MDDRKASEQPAEKDGRKQESQDKTKGSAFPSFGKHSGGRWWNIGHFKSEQPCYRLSTVRILCISSFFREEGGGVAHMAHLLARELSRMPGNEVTLAAHVGQAAPADSSEDGYARMPIRATNWFESRLGVPLLLPHPLDIRKLNAAARAADVVMVHDTVYLSNLVAIVSAHGHTPSIVVKHTGEVRFSSRFGQLVFSIFNGGLVPSFLERTDALAFVTRAKLDNSAPIKGPLTTVISNGIDTDIFAPSGVGRDGSLLFVSRFVEKKGVEVVREMARLMPDRQFVLAGYGTIDPRGWSERNIACHWRPRPEDLAALYSTCGAFILPGETEGTPLVALEALACEAPTIIGEKGVAPDPNLGRQMAHLPVDISNPRATARNWCSNLDLAIARSKPDRSVIIRDYSAQRMAREYATLIDKITTSAI
ncbi:MAG: glycosyltransferase family 4 protein [Pseudorhizobium sp.]